MKIGNSDQNNRLIMEQLNKIMAENSKLSDINDMSKELPDKIDMKENLESNLIELAKELNKENELRLYDRKGNLDEQKINSQVIMKLKNEVGLDKAEVDNKAMPIINQQMTQKEERQTTTSLSNRHTAEYFTAIYNMVRDKIPIGDHRNTNRKSRSNGFKLLGIFGLVFGLIFLLYLLAIK